KGKPLALACVAVRDNPYLTYLAIGGEELGDLLLAIGVGEVADVNAYTHSARCSLAGWQMTHQGERDPTGVRARPTVSAGGAQPMRSMGEGERKKGTRPSRAKEAAIRLWRKRDQMRQECTT